MSSADTSLETIESGLSKIEAISDSKVVIRQLQITDLSKAVETANKKLANWQQLNIYADQIQLDLGAVDAGYTLDMGDRSSLTIVARSIAFTGEGTFSITNMRAGHQASVRVLVQDYQATNPIVLVGGTGQKPATQMLSTKTISNSANLGASVSIHPFFTGTVAPVEWTVGSEFYWLLLQTFQSAFALSEANPTQAKSMFQWIADNTVAIKWEADSTGQMTMLGSQAVSMLQRLSRPTGVFYVPLLEGYSDVLKDQAQEASQYEATFNTFMTQVTDYKLAAQNARTLIGDDLLGSQIKYDQTLIKNAETKLSLAQADLRAKITRLTNLQIPLTQTESAFKEAVDEWKKQAEIKAYVELATFAIKLGSSIASEDYGALIEVPSKVIDMATEFDEIAEKGGLSGDTYTDLNSVNQLLKNIGTQSNQIVKYANTSNTVYNYAKNGDTAPSAPDTAKQPVIDGTQWQVLSKTWDNTLSLFNASSYNQSVADAATQLKTQIDILAIYGQAVTSAQLAIVNLQEQLSQLHLQQNFHAQQKALVDQYADQLEKDEKGFYETALLVRQRYMSVKRSFLLMLEDYNDAYRYWALRSPLETTELIGTVANSTISAMPTVATTIDKSATKALENFASESRPENIVFYYNLALSDADKTTLVNGDTLSFTLSYDDNALGLQYWDRARVSDVSINLVTTTGEGPHTLTMSVQDNGVYEDRFNQIPWSFTAEKVVPFPPTTNNIALADMQNIGLQTKGAIKNLSQDDSTLYQPSLCTTWSFQIRSTITPSDLANVSHVQLHFTGTAIGTAI